MNTSIFNILNNPLYIRTNDALLSIGFTPEEVQTQLGELSDAIGLGIMARLAKEESKLSLDNVDALREYYQNHKDDESFKVIVREESGRISKEYLSEITQSLTEQQQQDFFAKLIGITP